MRIAAGLILTMLIGGLLASSATAVDGVLEINQTCGAGAGCFAGDTAGYPVQITAGGSYRLTSNLEPPNQNTDVISISVTGGVTVDLNGFAIQGTNTFAGTGLPGACSAPGTGVGVRSSGASVALANGHVRGMGSRGVELGGDSRVDRLIAEQNCEDGIQVSSASLVTDTVARRNRGFGVTVGPSSRIRNCTAELNSLSGVISPFGAMSVDGCVANGNGASGIHGAERLASIASLVLSSETNNNAGFGILVKQGSLVLRSSTNSNTSSGVDSLGSGSSGVGFITSNGNADAVTGAVIQLACSQFDGVQSCP